MNNIIRTKCIIIGDATVGKTALVQSFLSEANQFPKNYNMTLGIDLQTKVVNVPDTATTIELFLHDCSGKEFYRPLVLHLCQQPSSVILAYDVTSESTFNSIQLYYDQLKGTGEALCGVLYGCKTDLISRRLISPKAGRELAEKLGLVYFEGSPKERKGVEEPFFFLANEWFKTYTDKTQALRLLA